jgi:Protein of unknown function (DUF2877)
VKVFAATAIARPLEAFLQQSLESGVVRGSSPTYAYIEVGSFVVAVTGRNVPLMPNCVAVTQTSGLEIFEQGSSVRIDRLALEGAHGRVNLGTASAWNPSLAQAVAGRGTIEEIVRGIWSQMQLKPALEPTEVVESLSVAGFDVCRDDAGRRGVEALFDSVAHSDPGCAHTAVALLLGRGPGLTPEGDDFLAAAAATVVTFAPSYGWSSVDIASWTTELLPAEIRARTSWLSATLLELATEGMVSAPVIALLDAPARSEDRLEALARLNRVGHGTGRAWAAGCAATLLTLSRSFRKKPRYARISTKRTR